MKQVRTIRPEVLPIMVPSEIGNSSVCLLVTSANFYYLSRVMIVSGDDSYAFIHLGNSNCWANGMYLSIEELVKSALSYGKVYVFDSVKEMAQFIVERKV